MMALPKESSDVPLTSILYARGFEDGSRRVGKR
jgi:hypothetical protein